MSSLFECFIITLLILLFICPELFGRWFANVKKSYDREIRKL